MTSREPARCGTDSGYNRHKRNGTQPCVACCDAHAAYQRHLNHGERPCDACREAKRLKSAALRQLVTS